MNLYCIYIYIYRNWSIALLYYGGGDSHCYVCLCLFCREDDVNELENKKSSARKQWVRPIFQDRFSATFRVQALFFISRFLNSLEVVSYKTGNRFGESRHIENCAWRRLSSMYIVFETLWLVQRGEFHISHDTSRQISVFSPRWKQRSRVSREIFNDLNFKMQLIQGKFQWALLIFGILLIM